MASATMGLRRRVPVNNNNSQSQSHHSSSSKRTRTENNNNPSHGNLNSLNSGRDEPPTKKSRGTSGLSSNRINNNTNSNNLETNHGTSKRASSTFRSRVKSPQISSSNITSSSTTATTTATATSTAAAVCSNGGRGNNNLMNDITNGSCSTAAAATTTTTTTAQNYNVLTNTAWSAVQSSLSETAAYAAMSGLSVPGGQSSLCNPGLSIPSAIPYMATSMATFVGNATNLNKNSSTVSYLDISNMTSGSLVSTSSNNTTTMNNPSSYGSTNHNKTSTVPDTKSSLSYTNVTCNSNAPGMPYSTNNTNNITNNNNNNVKSSKNDVIPVTVLPTIKFQSDTMFNTYQPWVIKTYGDLAKTKTITIKKYARILRTLRGEEVNSAENSKFRFWVKSKGFHIGQPDGYDAKPADRIIGRHAVTSPGLDPPLYVPTQPPHNKALSSAEGTVPGRVFKKVAIVENFFDIIHAVHVDLEGRPGKHAGQKRTYRTITETYAFLPREAVTRFLLGCTECQRRPRTPSPTNLTSQSQLAAAAVTGANSANVPAILSPNPNPPAVPASTKPAISRIVSTPPIVTITTATPPSPTPAIALSASTRQTSPRPREASNPPESKSLCNYRHNKHQRGASIVVIDKVDKQKEIVKDKDVKEKADVKRKEKEKEKEEKYNPLSITNLLKKEPSNRSTCSTLTLDNVSDSRRTPESDHGSSKSSNSSKRRRMLPERTPSPAPSLPLARPWSPGLDIKDTPVDYSLPITTIYLKHQQKIQAEKDKAEVEAAAAAAAAAAATFEEEKVIDIIQCDSDVDRGRFSPAAGLIDTNLNLLATIQHLHCQVMLALTERLRGPNLPTLLPSNLMYPPPTPYYGFYNPNFTVPPPFTHHQL